eukprot:TRINITY_DN10737_c0_g1_i1.p1 TRINITY_DN10737_c0_g1~~TRINITY_DN10737_c0_g1_i1.p1  ORF type:complete len:413 (+),score=92.64 TRINITY_DN10737_c0_g1_i1:150-1388(+)
MYREGFLGTIGNTALVDLRTLSEVTGCKILAKAEFLNPGGSVKDRAAKYMIHGAEKSGKLKPGGTVVEGTAGNTGVGLALAANAMGYECLVVVHENVAREKIDVLRAVGAQVEIVPSVPYDHPNHFQKAAQRRAEEIGGYWTNQFYSADNLRAHYETTGPEIWTGTDGRIDAFVSVAGTGGTLGGTSTYLKERNPNVLCMMADGPGTGVKFYEEDGVIRFGLKSDEEVKAEGPGTMLEGIGSSRVYYPLSQAKLDGVFHASDQLAVEMTRYLLKHEGFYVGGSSGLNVLCALWTALLLGPGHTIVTVLCEVGNNARSKVFNDEFLAAKGIKVERTRPSDFVDAFRTSAVKAFVPATVGKLLTAFDDRSPSGTDGDRSQSGDRAQNGDLSQTGTGGSDGGDGSLSCRSIGLAL